MGLEEEPQVQSLEVEQLQVQGLGPLGGEAASEVFSVEGVASLLSLLVVRPVVTSPGSLSLPAICSLYSWGGEVSGGFGWGRSWRGPKAGF